MGSRRSRTLAGSTVEFQSDVRGFVGGLGIYLAILGLLLSGLLAGPAWLPLAVVLLVPLGALLGLLGLALSFHSVLHFDDEARQVVPKWGRPFDYDGIEGWTLREEWRHFSLDARLRGRRRPRWVAAALPEASRELVESALEQRWPEAPLSQRSFPAWALWLGLLLPGIGVYWPFVLYLEASQPGVFAELQAADWLRNSPSSAPEGMSATIADWRLRLPAGFELAEQGDSAAVSRDAVSGARIVARADRSALKMPDSRGAWAAPLLLWAFHIDDTYDLFRFAYRARGGLVPLLMKSVVLGEEAREEVRLWEGRLDGIDALVREVRRENGSRVEVLLRDAAAPTTLLLEVRSPHEIRREFLVRLLAGVTPPAG